MSSCFPSFIVRCILNFHNFSFLSKIKQISFTFRRRHFQHKWKNTQTNLFSFIVKKTINCFHSDIYLPWLLVYLPWLTGILKSPRCDIIDWHYNRGLNNSKLTVWSSITVADLTGLLLHTENGTAEILGDTRVWRWIEGQ